MNKISFDAFTRLARSRWLRGVLAALALIAVVGGMTRAVTTMPPTISLASEPLYARGFRSKPSLTLALSVEFPTVGAAYRDVASATNDATYSVANVYVGYYDPEACYTYDKTNSYFVRSGAATAHTCGGSGFSGNFMNWSTSSAIDILRYALTGGDRLESFDTASQTVLQRAVLPSGFYNSSANFPSKQITSAQAAGAVPSALLNGYTGTVYVANCLAQIYFGTSKTGSCGAAGDNGKLLTVQTITPVATSPVTASGTYSTTACAAENGTCTFPASGTYNVAFGANGNFIVKSVTGTSVSCSNAVFTDPAVGYGKSCYLPSTGAVLSNDPYFYARVKVCDTADAAARPDLCLQYPNGNYKPVGNLQKYSDRIRVAVFGYLMDQTTLRNGGVLRSPMKYVGPNTYDNSFNLVSGTNPLQEWNSNTGVFYANPSPSSDTTMSVSGAINYTNHFGRTGTTQAVYKTYDPVAELYYEALRYLQGLQPTPSAVSSITAAMKDGFPVYDTWPVDPNPVVSGLSDYSCVKNNILTIGDVNTHGDRYIPGAPSSVNSPTYGDTARPANANNNEPDFFEWTNVVGAFESNVGRTYKDGLGRDQTTSNPMTVNAFFTGVLGDKILNDYNGYYMAGMAYWANTHDIRAAGLSGYSPNEVTGDPTTYVKARPGMRVTSYFIDVNEGGSGTTLAGRKSNTYFLSAKYGGFSDDSTTGSPFRDAKMAATDADWVSTTSPGDPKTYFLGSNGAGMINALNNVFSSVAKQAGSIAGAALSGGRVVSSAGVYQAKFDPSNWSGDVVDYPITVNNSTVTIGDDTNPTWRASTTATTTGTLDNMAASSRNIYIGRTVPSAVLGTAVEFKSTAANFEATTKTALQTPPPAAAPTNDPNSTFSARVDYLRGDASNEGTGLFFRGRSGHKLGDIVNSAVVYSGAPSASITDTGYSSFFQTHANRAATVYVGANDGMLHAFDAATGVERFAYIPSFLIPKLSALTSPSYVHASYVDATPAVAEAQVGSSTSNWKTVLVSGAGAGAQGVFALDVTNPSAFTASNVMWEFTDSDDADMGNVLGRPQILKVRTSAKGATTPTYRWYAVVASGVNNYASDGHASTTGAPTIFLLDLAKQAGDAWTLGTNYFKISFPVGDTGSGNGILGFTAVDAPTGEVGIIYAGDLQGNLWKLNFANANFSSSSASGNWDLNTLSAVQSSSVAAPLFIAKDATTTPKAQPITIEPAVVFGPNGSYIVIVGTGRFLQQADVATPYAQQSIYAVYDDNKGAMGSATDSVRGYLKAASASGTTVTTGTFTYGRPSSPTDVTVRAGWYLDFPSSTTLGERMISGVSYFGTSALFGTIEPPANGCADGSGNQYVVDIATGNGTLNASPVGLQGQPIVVKIGVDIPDGYGNARRKTQYQIFQQGSDGIKLSTTTATTTVYSLFKRLSWRQLANPQ